MIDHSFRFYEHNGDDKLARSLGLDNCGKDAGGGWLYLGTVTEPVTRPWSIGVFVYAAPAQFWRFDIRRTDERIVEHSDPPSREPGDWHVETDEVEFRLSTGSGGFGRYWDIARMFADGMLSVEKQIEVKV